MKKLALIIFLLSTTFANYLKGQVCLNKYTQSEAITMRTRFLSQKPNTMKTPTSVWFSATFIKDLLGVLNSEIAPNLKHPDGIRIYFGTDSNKKNTVLLVSTYALGKDTTVPSGTYHQDYFAHNMTGISTENGLVSNDDCNGGASLYTPCGGNCPDDLNCKPYDPAHLHYITRVYGEKMVAAFKSSPVAVSTNSEWFDIDMLTELDSQMRKTHLGEYDGLRIYFGKHSPGDPILANVEAFVIEPTVRKDINHPDIHVDSFNCNIAALYFNKIHLKKMIALYLSEYQKSNHLVNINKAVSRFKAMILANGSDNGEVCPIHCQGATLL